MERVGVPAAPPPADTQWPALRWSDDQPLDLGAVVARCEFPQLVRLVDDVVNSLGATVVRSGAVLKLHGLKTFKRLLLAPGRSIADGRSAAATVAAAVEAQRGHQLGGDDDQLLAMSLGYPARVRLLPMRATDHVYPTAGDLIAESPRPRAVVVHRRVVLTEKGYAIAAGDVLRVDGADKRCTSAGVVDYLQCRHQERTVGLPAACVGHFTALADEREYAVRELAEPDGGGAIELPQRVRFLPLSEELRNGGSNEGALASLSLSYALSCADLAEMEYVACALQRRQYAVCTTDGEGGGDDEWLYLIPVNDPLAVDGCGDQLMCANAPSLSPPPPPSAIRVRVHLPLFHDLASYNAVHGRFRANLSMKHVVDCAPVERASTFDAYRCSMRDGYDLVTPAVVPRRHCRGSPSTAVGGSECFELTSGSDDTSDSRRSSSSRNGVAEDEKIFRLAPTSTCDHDTAPALFVGSSIGLSSCSGCDNAYIAAPFGFSPDSRRRSSGAAAAASKRLVASSSSAASPSLLRHQLLASSSQPATPQASRQKKVKTKWTEKLAQSLSNLRLAGGGSNSGRSTHSGSGPKSGRGSSTSPLQRRHLLTSGGGSDPTSTSSAESSDNDDEETEMTAAATAAASFGGGRQPHGDRRSPAAAAAAAPDDSMRRRGSNVLLPDSVPSTSGGGGSAAGTLYENVSAVLLGIGFGRASPQQQRQSPAQPPRAPRHEALGAQLLHQQQQQQAVRELWAPPSLPDYRDHTTGAPQTSAAAAAATAAVTPAVSVTAGVAAATGLSSVSFERRPSSDAAAAAVCASKAASRMSPSCSVTRMGGVPLPPPPQPPERPAPSRSPCLPSQYGCQLPATPADRFPVTSGGMPVTHQQRSLLPTAVGGSGPVVVESLHVTSFPENDVDEYHAYTYLYFPPAADSVVAAPAQSLTGSESAGPTASCWRSRSGQTSPPGNSSSGSSTSASYGATQFPAASQDNAVSTAAAAAASTTTSSSTTSIVRSLADVPDDLSTLSVVGLCSCLRLYNMANVAEKFLQQQVDGQFFMAMPETMFRDRCFDLSEFEVLKLKRLQNGWRPKMT